MPFAKKLKVVDQLIAQGEPTVNDQEDPISE